MISGLVRRFGPAVFALAAAAVGGGQMPPPPGVQNSNPACVRLEGYLANIDRGGDAARAEQVRRYEDSAQRQQQDIDRASAQAQQMGCSRSTFFLFSAGQPPQCDRLNNQIQSMRANLDRITVSLQQMQASRSGSDGQRQQVLAQLAQNNCGPQYRAAAAPAGPGALMDSIFGGNNPNPGDPNAAAPAGTFRTVCVRTCDGFFFPVSYATVPARFGDDERACQRMCPASEVALYSYRNPGEDMKSAVSTAGRPYSELPTAFRYRQEFNAACSCRQAGQSWADALKNANEPVERGDVVVTEEKARTLSQPPAAAKKQNTRNTKTDPKAPPVNAAAAPPATDTPPPAADATATNTKRTVRTVGPPPMVAPR